MPLRGSDHQLELRAFLCTSVSASPVSHARRALLARVADDCSVKLQAFGIAFPVAPHSSKLSANGSSMTRRVDRRRAKLGSALFCGVVSFLFLYASALVLLRRDRGVCGHCRVHKLRRRSLWKYVLNALHKHEASVLASRVSSLIYDSFSVCAFTIQTCIFMRLRFWKFRAQRCNLVAQTLFKISG